MAEERHRVTAVNGEEVGGNNNNNTMEEDVASIRNISKVKSSFFSPSAFTYVISRNQPATEERCYSPNLEYQ